MNLPGLKPSRRFARLAPFLLIAALLVASVLSARAEISASDARELLRDGKRSPAGVAAALPEDTGGGDLERHVKGGAFASSTGIDGRIDLRTGIPPGASVPSRTELARQPVLLDAVGDIGFGPDGHLYLLVSYGFGFSSALLRYDPATGSFRQIAASANIQGEVRTDLKPRSDGNTYLSGSVNGLQGLIRIRDLATGRPLSSVPTVAFGPGQPPVIDSLGVGSGGTLDLPYADLFFRFDLNSRLWPTPVSTGPPRPSMENWVLVLGPEGTLYAEYRGESGIYRFDAETGAFLGRFDPAGAAVRNVALAGLGESAIPEPATLVLLGAGCAGLLLRRRAGRSPVERGRGFLPT